MTYETIRYTIFEIWYIDKQGKERPTLKSYKSKKLAENWIWRTGLQPWMQSYFIKEVPTIHQKLISI